jgi:hypothetical protein
MLRWSQRFNCFGAAAAMLLPTATPSIFFFESGPQVLNLLYVVHFPWGFDYLCFSSSEVVLVCRK